MPAHPLMEEAMTILTLWSLCALLIPAIHLPTALLVDGRIALGTWTRLFLGLFMLLGPLGLLLELWLLAAVLSDLHAELRRAPRPRHRVGRSWVAVPRRSLAKGSGLS